MWGSKVGYCAWPLSVFMLILFVSNGPKPTSPRVSQLTTGPTPSGSPSFSPKGTEIVYVSTITSTARKKADNSEIFVMRANGSRQVNLTKGPAGDFAPQFSPDGSKIVFVSDRDGNPEIYFMDSKGRSQKRLTHWRGFDGGPTFNPDGKSIVFFSTRTTNPKSGTAQLFVMNLDGSSQRPLGDGIQGHEPSISPDGTTIVFTSTRDGSSQIYAVDSDGRNLRRLTDDTYKNRQPVFTRDGLKIVFTSDRDGNQEIYIMNRVGKQVKNLSNNPSEDYSPAVDSQGDKLLFVSDRGGSDQIYITEF